MAVYQLLYETPCLPMLSNLEVPGIEIALQHQDRLFRYCVFGGFLQNTRGLALFYVLGASK